MTATTTTAEPLSSDRHAAYLVGKEPVLTARHVSIDYEVEPVVHAVKDVSLTLHRGEILGLAGESGCGKTTLAYGLNRLLKPPALLTSGTVTFHDQDGPDVDVVALTGDALRAFRWDKVSMVFQGAMNSLNPVISVRDQLGDVLKTHRPGMSRAERASRSAELLELVGVDPLRLDSYAHELSGGMRQRVAFLRTLLAGKPVLLLDEPFAALDAITRGEMQAWLAGALAEAPRTTVLVTHDVEEALYLCDRVVVLSARPARAVAALRPPAPRHADRAATVTQPEFAALRERALTALREGSR